jgi:hypothetical protein
MSNPGESPLWPTREFYETDPRAAILRNATLEAATALGGVLSVGRDEYVGPLLDENSRLVSLGVEPGMHSFEPEDPDADIKAHKLKTDPVTAAEYAAGFTREAIEYLGLGDGGVDRVFEEHDELQDPQGGLRAFNMNAMGPNSRQLIIGTLILQRIENLLSSAEGPSELPG